MDVTQQDALVRRLVENPQDEEALHLAHRSGSKDPALYAHVLERIGYETSAPETAAHWLVEAASVWSTSFADAHRAATLLMAAIERDPTSESAATRLGNLYVESGDHKALVALTERRASAVAKLVVSDDTSLSELASSLYDRAGRLWLDPPLKNAAKAAIAYRRAIELDAANQFAIYSLRELHKSSSRWAEALPLFAMEIRLEDDPGRLVSLFADEAEVAKHAGEPDAALRALRSALRLSPHQAALQQQFSSLVLELHRSNHALSADDVTRSSELFVGLAKESSGEAALLYAACAVELQPTSDQAMEMALDYASELGRSSDIAYAAADYVRANPQGVHVNRAREVAVEHGVLPEVDNGERASRNAPPPTATAGDRSPGESSASAANGLTEPNTLDSGMPGNASEVKEKGAVANLVPAHAPEANTAQSDPVVPSQEFTVSPAESLPQSAEDLRAEAEKLIDRGRRSAAAELYLRVLELEPLAPDAIEFVRSQLLAQRKVEQLAEYLLTWSADARAASEDRGAWLREAAELKENELEAPLEAIAIWQQLRQLDGQQQAADAEIVRLLQASGRWEQLAELYRNQVSGSDDLEFQLARLSELEVLYRDELDDRGAAARCVAERAQLCPGEGDVALQAVEALSASGLHREVVEISDDLLDAVAEPDVLAKLYSCLVQSHRQLGETEEAASALRNAADQLDSLHFWKDTETAFLELQDWQGAANAADEVLARLASIPEKVSASIRASSYLKSAGEVDAAVARLEEALEFAPGDSEATEALQELLNEAGRHRQLATFWLVSADGHPDPSARIKLRKQASELFLSEELQDSEAAREALIAVLSDTEDASALEWLAVDALEREAHQQAADYLARLGSQVRDPEERVIVLMREAEAHRNLGDLDACADRYAKILDEVDSESLGAVRELAPIELERGNSEQAAARLERWLKLLGAEDQEEKLKVAGLLSPIYEERPERVGDAIRILELIHAWDPDDFDATTRLKELARGEQQWERVVELTRELMSVEGDEEELSRMTLEVARIEREHLNLPDDAIATLTEAANAGDKACQEAVVNFGIELGRKLEVAQQIVGWTKSLPPSEPTAARLETAFSLFDESDAKSEALQVAIRLARTRRLSATSAARMETLAEAQADTDALTYAQDVLLAPLAGEAYASEAVRQAEVRVRSKVPVQEAIAHAEQRLTKVDADSVLPLLPRLSALCTSAESRVEVYERHASRCQTTEDRLTALCEIATVALAEELPDRAVTYFEIAASAAPQDDQLDRILASVRDSDRRALSDRLVRVLVRALQNTAGSLEDLETKSRLFRRAAEISFEDLEDAEQAFSLLTEAMAAHASEACHGFLYRLASESDGWYRADRALETALTTVGDSVSTRELLKWRAEVLLEKLDSSREAAEILQRLHGLSPSDEAVSGRLRELYEALEDHRGLARLLEDSILRTRDVETRTQLARRVALLWQDELSEPREAADAWRRVLRLNAGDEEAKAGLAQAKERMLSGSLMPDAAAVDEP